ncbi:MAG: prolipoprotein diacylglyceryl transferase [Clostridia bacterium]|nr:prolipoprotein diacylglyceryl transferase [Clostridia bacterium]
MLGLLARTNILSFPGLGIGEFEINKFAISGDSLPFLKVIFGDDWGGIAWYGVIIMCGIILAALYGMSRAKIEGISSDDILDVIIVAVIVSIIGARLYYVIFYGGYDSLYDLIAVWNGGLAIYGAVIGGILSLIVMGKIKKIPALRLLDIGASSIILGQAIGRWGNFVNAEAYGYETTLPWRMGIGSGEYAIFVHPTFLYESLWNLIGFFLIWSLYKKKKYDGQMFLVYLTWYGFGRMLIEGLRTDSLWLIPDVVRVSQLVGVICFVLCGSILAFMAFKSRKAVKNGSKN